MSLWKFAMIAIIPLMWTELRLRGFDPQKVRVWLAMMGGSLVAKLVGFMAVSGADQLGIYIALDIAVASVILAKPRGLPQKSIGALSGVMVLFGVGYLLSVTMGGGNPSLYGEVMQGLSWARWGILFSWGAGDAVEMALHRNRLRGLSLDRRAGVQ